METTGVEETGGTWPWLDRSAPQPKSNPDNNSNDESLPGVARVALPWAPLGPVPVDRCTQLGMGSG